MIEAETLAPASPAPRLFSKSPPLDFNTWAQDGTRVQKLPEPSPSPLPLVPSAPRMSAQKLTWKEPRLEVQQQRIYQTHTVHQKDQTRNNGLQPSSAPMTEGQSESPPPASWSNFTVFGLPFQVSYQPQYADSAAIDPISRYLDGAYTNIMTKIHQP